MYVVLPIGRQSEPNRNRNGDDTTGNLLRVITIIPMSRGSLVSLERLLS